jgi:hypothetical protein
MPGLAMAAFVVNFPGQDLETGQEIDRFLLFIRVDLLTTQKFLKVLPVPHLKMK